MVESTNDPILPMPAHQADSGGGQCEPPTFNCVQLAPAGDENRQKVAMGEYRNVTLRDFVGDPTQESVSSITDVGH